MAVESLVWCPRCDGSMVIRDGPRGRFWGCRRFPNCRGTRRVGTKKVRGVGRREYRPRTAPTTEPAPPASVRPSVGEFGASSPTPTARAAPDIKPPARRTRSRWWLAGVAVAALAVGGWATSAHPTGSLPSATLSVDSGGPGGPQFNGYVVVCADGWISHSGGRQGACSGHGGIGGGTTTRSGPQTNGYTVRCADGSLSNSGGKQGACSHHGGVR